MRPLFALLVVAFLVSGRPCQAGFTVYTTEASFRLALQATPAPHTETFDSIPGYVPGELCLTHTLNANGYQCVISTGLSEFNAPNAGGGFDVFFYQGGLYQSAANGYLDSPFLGTGGFNATMSFQLSNNVTAFGGYLFLTDTSDRIVSPFEAVKLYIGGTLFSLGLPNDGDVSKQFFGVTSTAPIGTVTMLAPTTFEYLNNLDHLTVGTALPVATPLPPTAVLAGFAGLLPLLGVARRRLSRSVLSHSSANT